MVIWPFDEIEVIKHEIASSSEFDKIEKLNKKLSKYKYYVNKHKKDSEYGGGGLSRYTIDTDILDDNKSLKPDDIVNGMNEMLRDLLPDINKDSSNGKSYDSRDSMNPIEPYDPDTYGEK